jgi:hypothetical protein
MQTQIIRMINDFEHGQISRRQLIAHLTWLVAVGTGASQIFAQPDTPKPPDASPTFQAVDLNHVALSMRDVQRSQKWYQQHLGLSPTGAEGFLTTGKGWLALFPGDQPGLHHYCYSIDNYDPDNAIQRLKAAGLPAKRRGGRVYFDDPDGIECQVAQTINR